MVNNSIKIGQVWEMATNMSVIDVFDEGPIKLIPGDCLIVTKIVNHVFGEAQYPWIHCLYWGREFRLRDYDLLSWAKRIE